MSPSPMVVSIFCVELRYAAQYSSGKTYPPFHPAMFVSLNRLGSMVIDVEGPAMHVRFLRENGQINDYFSIHKAPVLEVTGAGQNVVLSWPTNAVGFNLEAAGELSPTSWHILNDSPAVIGNRYVLTNSPANPARFFRLTR